MKSEKRIILEKRIKSFEKRLDVDQAIFWNSLNNSQKIAAINHWMIHKKSQKSINKKPRIKTFFPIIKRYYRINKIRKRESILDYLLKN